MPKVEPFENYTLQYEEWFNIHKYTYKSEIDALRTLLPKSGVGLEVGVGSGRFAWPLKIKYGIEPSEKMKKIAEERGIIVYKAVAENLPFEDSKFDYALMVTTICFLDDLNKSLKEIYRVLKPGGSIIVGFIDKKSLIGKEYLKYKNESVFYKIAKFFSVDEVVKTLKNAGFGNFQFSQTIFHLLDKVKNIEPVKNGYGEGSFVVVKGDKIMAKIAKSSFSHIL